MPTSITATVDSDISYSFIKTGLKRVTETGTTGFSYTFTNGVGSGNIDHGVVFSGTLSSGAKTSFDLNSIDRIIFGTTASVSLNKLKGVAVYNSSTEVGQDLNIHATGAYALTDLFNGGSGNLIVKPLSVYQYLDPISGVDISSGNNNFTLEGISSSGNVNWEMVIIGVTGVVA